MNGVIGTLKLVMIYSGVKKKKSAQTSFRQHNLGSSHWYSLSCWLYYWCWMRSSYHSTKWHLLSFHTRFYIHPINSCKLDLDSARAVAASYLPTKFTVQLQQWLYLRLCSWTAAVGGSYEFVSSKYRCSALEYWAVFGKLGLNF